MTEIELETIRVEKKPDSPDFSDWTIEEGPSVSIIGSSVFEDLDPVFYTRVCRVLGHDGWFYAREGDNPPVVATGDPFDDSEYWTIHQIPE